MNTRILLEVAVASAADADAGADRRPANVRRLVERTGCVQIHGSFKRLAGDRLSPFGGHHETCGDAVRRVRDLLDEVSGGTTWQTGDC